ncbi:MAG: hypothetical protein LUC98_07805 [Lachnospiraceae bacterium]|nr:hypothetical protein [Lachnospiraceae bacterium]
MGLERIQAYNIGFYICLAIAVLGALLAVILFFTLRIKDAWMMNSGRAKSSSIRRMKEDGGRSSSKEKKREEPPGQKEGWAQTSVLADSRGEDESPPGGSDTTVLTASLGERPTEVLNRVDGSPPPGNADTEEIRFVLTKNILIIHTDEKITGGM